MEANPMLNVSSSGDVSREQENSDGSVGHGHDSFRRSSSTEDELKSAKAEMNEVREENTRLKMMLKKIKREYTALQMSSTNVFKQESKQDINMDSAIEDDEETDFVSLRLGRSPSEPKHKDDQKTTSSNKSREDEEFKDGLKLGLDFNNIEVLNSEANAMEMNKSESTENSLEELKKEDAGEAWPPGKGLKTSRSEDEELPQPSSVKRARVSVRARCDTPTMNDGCQWRKYGQKISKGNPCPRAYYRCTVAQACPVRKQVQRCADDMSILITTYEGTHNHPLPHSATAMASTTSAAASMLLSGSSSSTTQSSGAVQTSLTANLPNSIGTRPFYLPNTSSPSFPTITLDLTTSSSSSSSQFNMLPSNFQQTQRFPSRNLNFSFSESNIIPTIWSNGYFNYGTHHGRTSQEKIYHPYIEKPQVPIQQQPLTETLTKAITSDPSFRSVIAAALSSMVGAGGNVGQGNKSKGDTFEQNLKWGDQSIQTTSNPVNYLSQSSGSSSQMGTISALQQSSLPFSLSKTTTSSMPEIRDQSKF